jgi:hypothetical protein
VRKGRAIRVPQPVSPGCFFFRTHFLIAFRCAQRGGLYLNRSNSLLVELVFRCGLRRADAAHDNLRLGIVLAADRGAGQPAKHRDLSDVGQCIRDGRLKELLGRGRQEGASEAR